MHNKVFPPLLVCSRFKVPGRINTGVQCLLNVSTTYILFVCIQKCCDTQRISTTVHSFSFKSSKQCHQNAQKEKRHAMCLGSGAWFFACLGWLGFATEYASHILHTRCTAHLNKIAFTTQQRVQKRQSGLDEPVMKKAVGVFFWKAHNINPRAYYLSIIIYSSQSQEEEFFWLSFKNAFQKCFWAANVKDFQLDACLKDTLH